MLQPNLLFRRKNNFSSLLSFSFVFKWKAESQLKASRISRNRATSETNKCFIPSHFLAPRAETTVHIYLDRLEAFLFFCFAVWSLGGATYERQMHDNTRFVILETAIVSHHDVRLKCRLISFHGENRNSIRKIDNTLEAKVWVTSSQNWLDGGKPNYFLKLFQSPLFESNCDFCNNNTVALQFHSFIILVSPCSRQKTL